MTSTTKKAYIGAAVAALFVAFILLFVPTNSASATGGGNPEKVCTQSGDGWGAKVDTTGDPDSVTVTADVGYLISAYCVSGGQIRAKVVDVDPDAAVVVITTTGTPGDPDVSHYQIQQVPIEPEEPVVGEDVVVVNGDGDCDTLTQTVTTTTYVTIDGVRQEPGTVVETTIPWTPVGDECEEEEPPVPTETPTVPTEVEKTDTPTETPVVTETVVPTPDDIVTPDVTPVPEKEDEPKGTPNKDKPVPVKVTTAFACVDGVFVTIVKKGNKVVSKTESGSCVQTPENSVPVRAEESGL